MAIRAGAALTVTAISVWAAWCDRRTGLIPNALTLSLIGLGLLYQVLWGHNFWFPLFWAGAWLLWALWVWGGGDAKLVMGIFTFYPTREALVAFSLTLLLLGLGVLLRRLGKGAFRVIGLSLLRMARLSFPSEEELLAAGGRDSWILAVGGIVCALLSLR